MPRVRPLRETMLRFAPIWNCVETGMIPRLTVFLVGAVFASSAYAAALPRPCLWKEDDPQRSLPRQSDGTPLYRRVILPRGDRQIVLETFSDTAPSGELAGEHCFRWETVNGSGEDVHQFFWPAARRMRVSRLSPGEQGRRSLTARYVLSTEPRSGDNPIFAFERSQGGGASV
jgi:hypothetical protein